MRTPKLPRELHSASYGILAMTDDGTWHRIGGSTQRKVAQHNAEAQADRYAAVALVTQSLRLIKMYRTPATKRAKVDKASPVA